jgi:hypothetical protein
MPVKLISAALVVLVASVVAGCSTGNGTPTTSVPSARAGSASAEAPVPTGSSTATTPAPSGAAPSASAAEVPHDDAALEALLPDEVNDVALTKLSVGPISTAGNAGADAIRTLARDIGDGTGNFSLAFANDPRTPTFNLFALRIHGAKPDELARRYTALTVADEPGSTSKETTLGGRDVTEVSAPNNPIGDVWFYAKNDTVFGVQAGSPEQAESLLAQLP